VTVALALLLGALLVLWIAPVGLSALLRCRMEPQAALTAWLLLVTSTFLTLATAVLVTLLPGHGPAAQLAQLAQHGWTAVRHGSVPRLDAIVGLTGLAILSLTTVRVLAAMLRGVRLQQAAHRRHVDVLRGLARTEPGRYPLMWLDAPDPLAYSLTSGGVASPMIVATRGLADRLPAHDLAAVLEHERAHLRGHHHVLVCLAKALAAGLPRLPLMRRSPDLVSMLVELAADRAAARTHGPSAIRRALLAMAGDQVPGHALAMARDAVSVRLSWLESPHHAGRMRRAIESGLAALAAAILPAAVGIGLLDVTGLIGCSLIFLV
jgi:Zn-dependent protease with chaperone function